MPPLTRLLRSGSDQICAVPRVSGTLATVADCRASIQAAGSENTRPDSSSQPYWEFSACAYRSIDAYQAQEHIN